MMMNLKPTESSSRYDGLEQMSIMELLRNINTEDRSVPLAVEAEIPAIARLAEAAADRLLGGGRMFYMGAGTSGRLGIVDASECPPTFGVPHGLVIGLIAGGDQAIRKAVEFAEDSREQAGADLEAHGVCSKDIVIGIAASGTTPYVLGAMEYCRRNGITTGSICCNPRSPLSELSDYPVAVVTGPEFVTGSTRMKAGTAQKLVLNMISTTVMIRLGRVEGNKMVNMQLSNDKLVERGTRMVSEATGLKQEEARSLLLKHGSVKKATEAFMASKG
jgi:N-acetylmuramic acid 6-phosphate etherase